MKHIRKAVIQQDDLTGEWTLKSEVELTCKFIDEEEEF